MGITTTYTKKSFNVEAVQVTAENIFHVAEWCNGLVKSTDKKVDGPNIYIDVKVLRPVNDRQKKAFVGDWVLETKSGFKVYQNEPFLRHFVKKQDDDEPNDNQYQFKILNTEGEWVEMSDAAAIAFLGPMIAEKLEQELSEVPQVSLTLGGTDE